MEPFATPFFFAPSRENCCQRACKPGSVHPGPKIRGCAAIPLGSGLPRPSSNQPGRRAGTSPYAAPIRSCTRWGLPCRPCCQGRGALLPHPFDLTRPRPGGLLSVALSLIRPRPKPSPNRRALPGTVVPWSPDFPRLAYREPRPPGPLATADIGERRDHFESALECLLRVAGTSPLRSNGEGDRSAARLSGGGANASFAQAIDAIRDHLGIGKHVSGGNPNDLQAK